MQLSEEQLLIDLLKQSNKGAFKTLYQKHGANLKALCRRFAISAEDSDDIIQETFKRIWEKRETLNIELSFGAYVLQIAKNIIYNQIRHSVYVKKYQLQIKMPVAEFSPDKIDLEKIINQSVLNLPDKCRYIYKRSRIDGWSNTEIAEELRISKKTVENQINKALTTIKLALKRAGYQFYLFLIITLLVVLSGF